jgi:hypothetical protein
MILIGLRVITLGTFMMPTIVMSNIRAYSCRLRLLRSVLLHQRGALVVRRQVLLVLLLEILFLLFKFDGIFDLQGTVHYLLMIVERPLVDVIDVRGCICPLRYLDLARLLCELPLHRFVLLRLRGNPLALLEGLGGPRAARDLALVESKQQDELLSVGTGEKLFRVLDVTQLFQSDVATPSPLSALSMMLFQVVALVRRHS